MLARRRGRRSPLGGYVGPMRMRVLPVALVVTAAFVAGPAEVAGAKTSTVDVKLLEFQVKPKPKAAAAGKVKFSVKNIGGVNHEMVIARTDGRPLPTKADGSVDETAAGSSIIGEVNELKPKSTGTVSKRLDPGTYTLFCNLVDTISGGTLVHYARGMHVDFIVR
jgi:uncharacterized cupredoxin-like copper-binding protein